MRNIAVESGGQQPMIGFQSLLRAPVVERDIPSTAPAFVGKVAMYLQAEREHLVPRRNTRFFANSHYVSHRSRGFGVSIRSMDECFKSTFLGKREVVEGPRQSHCLISSRVTRRVSAKDLVCLFGGEDKVTTTLSESFTLMRQQVRRVPGEILLMDRYPNVFIVPDDQGVLHAVAGRFWEGGWDLSITEDSLHYEWCPGSRIFLPAP